MNSPKNNIVFKYFQNAFLAQLLFGMDGVYCDKRYKWLIKVYSASVCLCVLILSFSFYEDTEFLLIHLVKMIEYVLVLLSCACTNSFLNARSFYCFWNYIYINLFIDAKRTRQFLNRMFATPVILVFGRIIYILTFCRNYYEICSRSWIKVFVVIYVIVAIELAQLLNSVCLSLIWFMMKTLRENLERKFNQHTFFSIYKNRISIRNTTVSTYMKIYKAILNVWKCLEQYLNLRIYFSLACTFPYIMSNFYLLLIDSQRRMDEWKVLLPVFLETLQVAFLPCLPGVVSECVACEVDKIKSTLLRHVANLPRSQEEYEEIQLFLRYLKTRGFHYRVWRTIRVDGRLLLGFIGLCTTYLIVLMQFTQFY